MSRAGCEWEKQQTKTGQKKIPFHRQSSFACTVSAMHQAFYKSNNKLFRLSLRLVRNGACGHVFARRREFAAVLAWADMGHFKIMRANVLQNIFIFIAIL